MDDTKDNRARKRGRAQGGDNPSPAAPATPVPTPTAARWVVRIGGGLALTAAAAISFQGLTGLGILIGIQHPWLLPIAIDIYAGTSTLLVLLLPAGHRALRASVWNARLGLAMSMSGNAVFRAVHLGSYAVSDGLMTFIGSWPSFIVERLLDLQGRLAAPPAVTAVRDVNVEPVNADTELETVNDPAGRQPPTASSTVNDETGNTGNPTTDTGNPTVNDNAPDRQTPTGNPSTDNPRDRQKPPVKAPGSGQTSTDTWVEIGKPVYDQLRAEAGKRPGETAFHTALAERVAELIANDAFLGEGMDERPDPYADPSLSTAKRIRKEIEGRFPGIVFGHHAEADETLEEVA